MPPSPTQSRLQQLFQKYVNDTLSVQELREFWELLEATEENDVVKRELSGLWYKLKTENGGRSEDDFRQRLSQERLRQKITQWEKQDRMFPGSRSMIRRFSVAAAILICAGLAVSLLYLTRSTKKPPATIASVVQRTDIAPGGNKAVLTLANGTKIILDSAKNGTISMQGNTKIVKLKSGQLAYNAPFTGSRQIPADLKEELYNTITTPRGGQYQVTLPDGTKVWLNAGSSLRFPNEFAGKERKVEVTGEAYFEVAKNEQQPFAVMADGTRIDVLGTHFDVMTYKDEGVSKVILLQGAVKVRKDGDDLILKPGQQAAWKGSGQMEKMAAPDLQGIIAWTNDAFWFNDDTIETVMRKLSRWYDVDIKIEGSIPQHFAGFIPRNVSFSKVFEVLQATGHMHYKIEGNQIIVSP